MESHVASPRRCSLADYCRPLCFASRGTTHFAIEKQTAGARTSVSVTRLSQDERVAEIARMSGGTAVTEAVRQPSREMLAKSAQK